MMKIILRVLIWVLALLGAGVGVLTVSLLASAIRPARNIGIDQVQVSDAGGGSIGVLIYYPTQSKPQLTWMGLLFADVAPRAPLATGQHALVVISHGTAGAATSHIDTAIALAERGFVVAAPIHNRDNFQDQSGIGAASWIADRAREIRRVNDFMLTQWRFRAQIDANRIGLFGFSAGATTALINVGAQPDFALVTSDCRQHSQFVCRLLRPDVTLQSGAEQGYDSRIKAVVLAAPGLGMGFTRTSLARVNIPVAIWAGDRDVNAPLAGNAAAIAANWPTLVSVHVAQGAGHFSFLAPCGPLGLLLPPMLCSDPANFDRRAFHQTFNSEVAAFFEARLGRDPPLDERP
ncbi:alpha/beta hydrolase family protein [Candidatus Viadribacter manganicus]|nr:dienelactone hydrolase family protein [Candidatus Viadribacter manganicus]